MKWKLFLRRLSISAPRMTVRTHRPWPLRVLRSLALVGVGGAAVLGIYDLGREYGPFARRADVADGPSQASAGLTQELDRLRAENLAAESKLAIERAAQQQLASQVMQLEKENMRLKEELAFFEGLPAMHRAHGVVIRSAQVRADPAARRLTYKLLIMQGGKPTAEFKGVVQLHIALQHAGKPAVIAVPVQFRYYQRVQGAWPIPDGAAVKAVDVRVLEGGALRAQHSVNL